jgi:hypothetical protein
MVVETRDWDYTSIRTETFKNKGPLKIVVEGDPALINRYDVIELNLERHHDVKLAPAHEFAAWLVSPAGQAAIGAYRVRRRTAVQPIRRPSEVKDRATSNVARGVVETVCRRASQPTRRPGPQPLEPVPAGVGQ